MESYHQSLTNLVFCIIEAVSFVFWTQRQHANKVRFVTQSAAEFIIGLRIITIYGATLTILGQDQL